LCKSLAIRWDGSWHGCNAPNYVSSPAKANGVHSIVVPGNKTMTGRERLQHILDGKTPDAPPHWELVFQLEKEMFGMDPDSVREADRGAFQVDVYHRLIDEFGWAAVSGGYDVQGISRVKSALGDKALVPAYEGAGVFWMPTGGDLMDFVVRLFEQPEELHAEARRKCDSAKGFFRQAIDAGADFFVLTYDFGYNDAPFVSPAQFAEIVTPYLQELVQTIHDLGRKAILHSDGCLTQVLDQIYSTGIDGYQSIDPQGHMDIRQVRALYPDWILMGNVACNMLQDANEGNIRQSVQYCMAHGGIGKRYIFSTSNCIFKGMPPQSYRTMLDEYRHLCRI
jgi:uroporphyrinogen decarboxylase